MKAMIMAAGVGSRLMPLTRNIPKPMIPMANHPLMENIIDLLKNHGFTEMICNLHYHAASISNYFTDGSKFGVSMAYSPEEELLGTAGGVKKCEWFLNDTFVVVSGDALTDVDLTYLVKEHRRKGALASIAMKEVEEVEHFGVVVTSADGRIEKFQEKPRPQEALSHQANTGIYIFEPEIFKYIPVKQFYDFGKQVFPHLVKVKAPFYGIPIKDYWCDVGNLNTYRQAHYDILQGNVQARADGKIIETGDKKRVLLGEGAVLGDNVQLQGNVVIGAGCRLEDNVVVRDSVIWDNTVIKQGARIDECVVGDHCDIGPESIIKPGAVVASGCILEGSTVIIPGQKVFSSADQLKLEQG